MKLLYFNDFRLGVLKGDAVVDVTSAVQKIPHTGPGDLMNGLIARFAEYRGSLEKAASEGKGLPVSQVKIRPPLPLRPGLRGLWEKTGREGKGMPGPGGKDPPAAAQAGQRRLHGGELHGR